MASRGRTGMSRNGSPGSAVWADARATPTMDRHSRRIPAAGVRPGGRAPASTPHGCVLDGDPALSDPANDGGTMTAVLEAHGFGKRYRRRTWALRGVDLGVPEGSITALVGPN